MIKGFSFCSLMLTLMLSACSLNADQEKMLSESTTRFLESRKKGALLAYVSMHHPDVVRFYKEQGDSSFTAKFSVKASDHFADEALIVATEKKGKEIQVLYRTRKVEEFFGGGEKKWDYFVALSDDNGRSWYYMEYTDYVDKRIAKDLDRMITLKE